MNAHATSTGLGDVCETRAIKTVFGEHAQKVSISSTKSMTGHLLGGAGAVEMAACALAIRDSVIPPTINLENPDEECDLDYTPNVAKEKKVRVALNNSFGFGGHNATLVAASSPGSMSSAGRSVDAVTERLCSLLVRENRRGGNVRRVEGKSVAAARERFQERATFCAVLAE